MGASIGTSDFDVFGDIRTQTGATSIFAFTGEQRETVTGMTYLRARYYEPGYGRFLSADTVQPGGPGTQGYNRYVYVGNNPCTTTDPSGHSTAFESYDGCVRVIRLVVAQMVQETLAYLNLSPLLTTTAAEYVQRMGGLLFLLFFFIRVCLELATRPDSGAGQGNPNSPSSPPALRSSPDGYPALPSSAT